MTHAGKNDPTVDDELATDSEALETVAVALTPIAGPSSQGLLARVRADASREALWPQVAELLDVAEVRARQVLRLVGESRAWEPWFEGAALIHLAPAPSLRSADVGLVRLRVGVEFPSHVHIGAEQALVVQGSKLLEDGTQLGPGDCSDGAPGTRHAFRSAGPDPLVYLVVSRGVDIVVPSATRLW